MRLAYYARLTTFTSKIGLIAGWCHTSSLFVVGTSYCSGFWAAAPKFYFFDMVTGIVCTFIVESFMSIIRGCSSSGYNGFSISLCSVCASFSSVLGNDAPAALAWPQFMFGGMPYQYMLFWKFSYECIAHGGGTAHGGGIPQEAGGQNIGGGIGMIGAPETGSNGAIQMSAGRHMYCGCCCGGLCCGCGYGGIIPDYLA